MQDNKILQIVYTFFLGLLLAIFVGVGISTFYPSPKMPDYPIELQTYDKEPTPAQTQKQRDYERQSEQHFKETKTYSRNVSIIALVAAVVFLVISLVYEKKIRIIADGVLLGGLFTLLYSIGRGFASEDTKYTFVTVTVGLVVALYLGYHRFIRTQASAKKRNKS